MTRGPFKTFLLVGTINADSLPEAVAEVTRRLDESERRMNAAAKNRLPRIFADLCEEFGSDEVIDLIQKEGAKGLEAVYA